MLQCKNHLGPTSKKNLAYRLFDILNLHPGYFLEMEDDVCIKGDSKKWLKDTISFIDEIESKNVHIFFNTNKKDQPNSFTGAANALSYKTKKYIGHYPSEITGEYISTIHELDLFPRDLQKLLSNKKIIYTGLKSLSLLYDIAAEASNYVSIARQHQLICKQMRFDLKKYIPIIYQKVMLYQKKYALSNYLNKKTHKPRILKLLNKPHMLVPLSEYQLYKKCIFLTTAEFNKWETAIKKYIDSKSIYQKSFWNTQLFFIPLREINTIRFKDYNLFKYLKNYY